MRNVRRTAAFAIALLGCLPGCKISPDPEPTPPPPRPTTRPAPPPAAAPTAPAAEAEPAATGALPPAPALPASEPPSDTPSGVPVTVAPAAAAPDEAQRATVSAEHVARVQAWLLRTRRAAVIVSRPENYAWLTAGESNRTAADAPSAAIAVLPHRALLVAPSDVLAAARAPLRGLGFAATTYRWDLGRDDAAPVRAVQSLTNGGAVAADEHRPGTEIVAAELAGLRLSLSAFERQRLTWLGQVAATAAAEAIEAIAPSTTEAELAAAVRSKLSAAGAEPLDVRVTALGRLERDGLAEPGAAALDRGAAVHVTAGRWGLSATVGRTVTLDATPDVADDYAAARGIYAALLAAAQPGKPLRSVFAAGAKAAAEVGSPNLFARVSPGYVGGYGAARSLAPAADEPLGAGQALTLTVRLPRAYLAETLLVATDGLSLVTAAGEFPSPALPVNGRAVPVPTLRGGELAVDTAERERARAARRAQRFRFLEEVVGGAIEAARTSTAPPAASPPPAPLAEAPQEPAQP